MSHDPRHLPTAADINQGRSLLLVPLGAWEQHGAHLPLATDSLIAERLCLAVALQLQHLDRQIVVAPTLNVSASDEHRDFAGTLSLGTETTTAALAALVRSAWWARQIIIVNGHGGNADALQALRVALAESPVPVSLWWPRIPDAFLPAMAADLHAGHIETSVMLHLFPDLVDMDRAQPGAGGTADTLVADMRRHGVAGVSANGVIGDPTTATPDDGEIIWNTWVDELAHFVTATLNTEQ